MLLPAISPAITVKSHNQNFEVSLRHVDQQVSVKVEDNKERGISQFSYMCTRCGSEVHCDVPWGQVVVARLSALVSGEPSRAQSQRLGASRVPRRPYYYR
jgi:hypothetical protein